jgi:Calx-beta domain
MTVSRTTRFFPIIPELALTGTGSCYSCRRSTVTLTVTDKDGATRSDTLVVTVSEIPRPKLSVNDITVRTDDRGTRFAVFTVSLDRPATETVSVDFETGDETAIAGRDYIARQGRITFTPGRTTATIEIELRKPLEGDIDGDGKVDQTDMNLLLAARNRPANAPQPSESAFTLKLTDASGALLDDPFGIGILLYAGLDPRDLDGDGRITVLDIRKLTLILQGQTR